MHSFQYTPVHVHAFYKLQCFTLTTGTLDKVKPTSRRPVTESTDEVERVEPIDADYQETEAPTQPTHLPTTSKWTESTDEIEGAEPIDTDNQETEAPTKPTHLPTTSKWHRQRPTLTKPVSTGKGYMCTARAINACWIFNCPPPPPTSLSDSIITPHSLSYHCLCTPCAPLQRNSELAGTTGRLGGGVKCWGRVNSAKSDVVSNSP